MFAFHSDITQNKNVPINTLIVYSVNLKNLFEHCSSDFS